MSERGGRRRHYPRPVPEVSDESAELDGLPVFWRSAPVPASGRRERAVPLYLHGVPGNSDEWVAPREHRFRRSWWRRWWRRRRPDDERTIAPPYDVGFLERSGGIALDLPGFGRSGKPGYLQFTIDEYAGFIERFLDELALERVQLVMHDWGSVGLAFAQRHPERVERLALLNAVPLLDGYEWHRIARLWRTPFVGELAMGCTTRSVLRRASEEANATPGPLPASWLDSVLDHFDQGTQRAILRLYRSAGEKQLAAAGANLSALRMPALVVWGMLDPYLPGRFAQAYAAALGDARLATLADAGHWPWLDRLDVIDTVVAFLAQETH
jgi:pimeloyl-ACP methyl ester carboxylesterase